MTKGKNEKQKPEHEIRFGRIKAAVWKNEGENGPRFSVTVCRLYKENPEAKQWSYSDSFGRDDLPLVCKVMDQAHTWIFQQVKEKAV